MYGHCNGKSTFCKCPEATESLANQKMKNQKIKNQKNQIKSPPFASVEKQLKKKKKKSKKLKKTNWKSEEPN